MRKQRAITLLEVVVSTVIVAVLFAIVLPALGSAKRSAQIRASLATLRSLHVAMALYRTEYDGDGRYGDLPTMGLPTIDQFVQERPAGIPDRVLSPCSPPSHSNPGGSVFQYNYEPADGGAWWVREVEKYRDETMLFVDYNCNSNEFPLKNEFYPHRGLGVRLSGQLVNYYKKGLMSDPEWWAPRQGVVK